MRENHSDAPLTSGKLKSYYSFVKTNESSSAHLVTISAGSFQRHFCLKKILQRKLKPLKRLKLMLPSKLLLSRGEGSSLPLSNFAERRRLRLS